MKVRPNGNCLHEFWVSSESDGEVEYLVRLGEYPLGLNANGFMRFNGACGANDGYRTHGCPDFKFRCEKQLRNPDNMGKTFRCKHVRAANEFGWECILPTLIKLDKNIPEEHQT